MDINKRIEEVAKKYNYNNELVEALKKCVPVMAKGKSNSEIELLMETLSRVEILDFSKQPTQQQLDEIEKTKTAGKNEHVKFIIKSKGEYGKNIAPGGYQSIAIFNENMDIVDRVGYIYLTRLSEYSQEVKAYQTTINLSHLIHELGHAWGAQKDEYVQKENGDFTCNVGAVTINSKVDRENCIVEDSDVKGLYIEEALNTLEEENTLCEILGIKNVNEIPGYVPSIYQGLMKSVMNDFVENIGALPFSKLRILKSNIAKYKVFQGLEVEEMAAAAGVSVRNMYSKIKDPETFRIKELRKLAKRMGVSITQLLEEKEWKSWNGWSA